MSYKDMEEYETSNTRNSNTSKIKENKNKETEERGLTDHLFFRQNQQHC